LLQAVSTFTATNCNPATKPISAHVFYWVG